LFSHPKRSQREGKSEAPLRDFHGNVIII
jgi:hypothetical protein